MLSVLHISGNAQSSECIGEFKTETLLLSVARIRIALLAFVALVLGRPFAQPNFVAAWKEEIMTQNCCTATMQMRQCGTLAMQSAPLLEITIFGF